MLATFLRRGGRPGRAGGFANLVLEGAASPEDPVKIAGWFKQAAAAADLVAAFNLGVCLVNGIGVDRDELQAAQWLRRAVDGISDA